MRISFILFLLFHQIFASNLKLPRLTRRFLRGLGPEKFQFYKPGKEFKCLNSHQAIPYNWINDDYCDCDDGSDEPGTSACPNSIFYCINSNYKPHYILSSRVDDGVCDCCDGSDEYSNHIQCTNNCKELGDELKEQQQIEAKLLANGYEKYLHYCQIGSKIREDMQVQLEQMEGELEIAEQSRQELEELKNKEEAAEKELKDQFDEVNQEFNGDKNKKQALDAFKLLDVNSDEKVDSEEFRTFFEGIYHENAESNKKENIDKYNIPEPMDIDGFVNNVWKDFKDFYANNVGFETEEEKNGNDDSNNPEGKNDEETGDDDDDVPKPEYNEETKEAIAKADTARTAFLEQEKKAKSLKNKFETTKRMLELDTGNSSEFLSLYNHCYDFTEREYLYVFCPFQHATQKAREGSGYTVLGNWGSWVGDENNKYSTMLYDNGNGCWNGPNRSVKVYLECGDTEELVSVSEPNRCEYIFTFKTALICRTPPSSSPTPLVLHDPGDL